MDPETISKKELLLPQESATASSTDGSAGLIRGLVQRKSTFTGQETFFPREKVLARIEKIKAMDGCLARRDRRGGRARVSMTLPSAQRGLVSAGG
jgi:hypothetical protein